LKALRLLYAVQPSHREKLTDALYHAYWVENADISQEDTLLNIVKALNIPFEASNAFVKDEKYQNALREATSRVVELGAPGVPFFLVSRDEDDKDGTVFWGQDRLIFVEATIKALQAGLDPMDWEKAPNIADLLENKVKQVSPHVGKGQKVTFYYDFASPWSYLGYTHLYRLKALGCDIDYRPVVVGAIFKS
jgi:2-hydroxychromene-2-carboxylate isomerase